MKRTALIAVMIAALAFGAAGFAVADTQDVVVTAAVQNVFSLTLDGFAADQAVDLGSVAVGDAAVTSAPIELRVKSNKLWDFDKEVAYDNADIADFMTEASYGTDLTGAAVTYAEPGVRRGNQAWGITYTLDLSDDSDASAAWDLDEGAYITTYTYTAVQQ